MAFVPRLNSQPAALHNSLRYNNMSWKMMTWLEKTNTREVQRMEEHYILYIYIEVFVHGVMFL